MANIKGDWEEFSKLNRKSLAKKALDSIKEVKKLYKDVSTIEELQKELSSGHDIKMEINFMNTVAEWMMDPKFIQDIMNDEKWAKENPNFKRGNFIRVAKKLIKISEYLEEFV